MQLKLLCKNNISCCLPCFKQKKILLHSRVSKHDKSIFLTGSAKLQNTPTSIVIIIFGAKSIGGCVRGRSRVPVTPKPAPSDHIRSCASIVRKFKNCWFCGKRKKFTCEESFIPGYRNWDHRNMWDSSTFVDWLLASWLTVFPVEISITGFDF